MAIRVSLVVETSSPSIARSPTYEMRPQSLIRESAKLADEKAFAFLLTDSIRESIEDSLGKNVLALLVSKGLLDDPENPRELERQLNSTFGNASSVLERIIVKGLYQKLRIPFDSNLSFDYTKALEVARNVHLVESRRK
ncbi:hypothetical protein E6H22_04550 [Candidatus Bathyarchaeota archaeon]|nr:MAG: hypothetical protein E6H22_04550 [Candidatus Bathyarchaeota archaeon]